MPPLGRELPFAPDLQLPSFSLKLSLCGKPISPVHTHPGEPKAALWSHRSLLCSRQNSPRSLSLPPYERCQISLSMYWGLHSHTSHTTLGSHLISVPVESLLLSLLCCFLLFFFFFPTSLALFCPICAFAFLPGSPTQHCLPLQGSCRLTPSTGGTGQRRWAPRAGFVASELRV